MHCVQCVMWDTTKVCTIHWNNARVLLGGCQGGCLVVAYWSTKAKKAYDILVPDTAQIQSGLIMYWIYFFIPDHIAKPIKSLNTNSAGEAHYFQTQSTNKHYKKANFFVLF